MATYRLRKVRRTLEAMGAEFTEQKGRPHATAKYHGNVARWPNKQDDPVDEWLLNQILKQLEISREAFVQHHIS